MASGILHFGQELSNRFPFLRNAGFSIHACEKFVEFQDVLQSGVSHDAVSFSDLDQDALPLALLAARTHSSAPTILFRTRSLLSFSAAGCEPAATPPSAPADPADKDFDLIIPPFASPRAWVGDLAALIVHCRAIQFQSQSIRQQSILLRQESSAARAASRTQRERAKLEHARTLDTAPGWTLMDRLLRCSHCGMEFVFSAGEQMFFLNRGFINDPRHCKRCRAELRCGFAIPRRATEVVCAECGCSTTVPFKPTQGRAVFCRSCLQKHRTAS
jgi:CxxC-x17-CxxC domain-containing protein